ncbi:hypothetical protein V9K92_19100 [Phyllobacterium sp. CCNWLW109]|uniref:hypothetical protein n=1 Tax=Phyllobacterium sp. CCNWLW109 TaxID=3127479 RepID=UPI003076AF82
MNRRSLLALIGFAPIATAAAALPRVADPVKLASTGGREVSLKGLSILDTDTGVYSASGIFRCQSVASPEGALSTISLSADKIYLSDIIDDVNNNLAHHLEWIKENSDQVQGLFK